MVRITKDPEERKREIMDVALRLFNEKGFEQTAVSDIVKSIGVAQGTFYYYFDSKESVLNAILESFMEDFKMGFETIANNEKLNASEKVKLAFKEIFSIGMGYDEELVEYIHRGSNAMMHQKVEEKALLLLKPLLVKILKEGISQGVFHSDYPEEVIEILLYGSVDFIHKYYFSKDKSEFKNIIAVMVDTVERVFGAEKGSIKVEF